MNWGNLSRGFSGVAIKRLSSHEVDPSVSNGHEFQGANNLTGLLGTEDRRNLPTTYYFISDDGAEPKLRRAVTSTSSWYDGRRKQVHRSPEWRLYYPASLGLVQAFCHPGDLLLLALKNDGSLAVFMAPAGSVSEQVLMQAFGVTQAHYRQQGLVKWMRTDEAPALDFVSADAMEQLSLAFSDSDAAEEDGSLLALTVAPNHAEPVAPDTEVGQVAARMLERWPNGKLGSNQEVVRIVVNVCDPNGDIAADPAMELWLEVAEAAYRIWEKDTFRRFISPLRADKRVSDVELVEKIGTKWMEFRQSRVSRAGKVMEEFLAILFRRKNLKFDMGAAAKTETSKLPDFLFPGGRDYHDPDFPAEKLRILGSKTSFKDRWTQILSEGNRVPRKHGVTRDSLMTISMFSKMADHDFIVVMPKPIIDRYAIKPQNLITLADFIGEIIALQV